MRIGSLLGVLLVALLSCRGSDPAPDDPADPTPARASGGRLGAGGASASGRATGGAGPSPATDGSGGYGGEDDAGAHGGAPDGLTGSGDLVDAADDSAQPPSDAGLARDTSNEIDLGRPAGNPCPGYRKGSHAQVGVTVADFCVAYLKSCPSDGELRLRDLADCQTSYGQAEGPRQTCLAGHLCEAIVSTGAAGKNMNCDAAGHARVCR
jgi:hypothetical protein